MNIVFDMVLSDGWMMICAVFTLLTYVLYRFAKNDSDVSSEAKKPYACGLSVDPDTQKLPSASFYKTVISVFKMDVLKKMHNDDLSAYIIWIFAGIFVVVAYFLFFA